MRLLAAIALLTTCSASAQTPVELTVDASEATRRLFHVRLAMPVKSGPQRLAYPKWIPGEHGPNGPVTDLVNLRISASGKTLPWQRDPVNMYVVLVNVPPGNDTLDISFDFLSPPQAGGFSSGASTTSQLMVLSWNQLLLYPEGVSPDQLNLKASLQVPRGWRFGTALPIEKESGDSITFRPSSLTTIVDSPVNAGRFYRTLDISPKEKPAHYIHIAADSADAIDIPQTLIDSYKNLVKETAALYGARHYSEYHFLVSLSDHIAHFGLEHHESSDNRLPESAFTTDDGRKMSATLLPHEMTHSWNGKYRRPAGLATGDYEKPMQGELLWVYEGLTTYLGNLLAPRSGLLTAGEYRQSLALTAAFLDNRPGRKWRPLADTAVAAQLLYGSRADWDSMRRSVDFYPEGELIWLDADVTIRKLSRNQRSLDDFVRAFFGGESGPPTVKPYVLDDVITALNAVQPNDWKKFFDTRVYRVSEHPPLAGIEDAGWKLVYRDKPNSMQTAQENISKAASLRFSIGFTVNEDGTIGDIVPGSPADQAAMTPATKVIAVNGRQFKISLLQQAIKAAKNSTDATELLVKDGEYFRTYRVQCNTGERYPDLERVDAKPDLLSAIAAPKASK